MVRAKEDVPDPADGLARTRLPLRRMTLTLTNTPNRRAFSALSHDWNFGLAISDNGPTL